MADANKGDFLDELADGEVSTEDLAETDPLLAEIEALRAERDDMKDRFLRALADAENARKRSQKDRREAEQYGGSKLARDMLPVYDNMKRALDAATGDHKAATSPASAASPCRTPVRGPRRYCRNGRESCRPRPPPSPAWRHRGR